jgi:hypothetical protein
MKLAQTINLHERLGVYTRWATDFPSRLWLGVFLSSWGTGLLNFLNRIRRGIQVPSKPQGTETVEKTFWVEEQRTTLFSVNNKLPATQDTPTLENPRLKKAK